MQFKTTLSLCFETLRALCSACSKKVPNRFTRSQKLWIAVSRLLSELL